MGVVEGPGQPKHSALAAVPAKAKPPPGKLEARRVAPAEVTSIAAVTLPNLLPLTSPAKILKLNRIQQQMIRLHARLYLPLFQFTPYTSAP